MSVSNTKISAILATYPGRRANLAMTINSLLSQVDDLTVVANQYRRHEIEEIIPERVRLVIPDLDLKDEGKFHGDFQPDQYVLLCDDDIIYPSDYASTLTTAYEEAAHLRPIIGVHGVTYSDFFDGKPESRLVHVFTMHLDQPVFVNQLGTGTVLCKGYQLPSAEFMSGSAKSVDLRFAVHCQRSGYPRICVARKNKWMIEQETNVSLFSSFTQNWPDHVTREAQEIAGMRFLPMLDQLKVAHVE